MSGSDVVAEVRDVDRLSSMLTAMWLSILGTFGILFLPLFVGGMISDLGFSDQQGGYIAAAEMAGVAIVSASGVFWVRKLNWRITASVSLVLFIAMNFWSTSIDSFGLMFVVRLIEGGISGALLAIGMACQSDHKNSGRNFGYWVAGQMTIQSLGYLSLPHARVSWGIDGLFLILVLIGVLTLLTMTLLPGEGVEQEEVKAEERGARLKTGAILLFAALLFFITQGGIWAFLERIGESSQLSSVQVGFALAMSSIFAVVAGLVRNWVADTFGVMSPFLFVMFGELLMLVLFATNPGYLVFTVAVCMLQFFWALCMCSLMTGFNLIDKSGGLVILLLALAKVGYSLGPALFGLLIAGDSYNYVFLSGGLLVVVGISIVMRFVKKQI